jgi:hypothetical protein
VTTHTVYDGSVSDHTDRESTILDESLECDVASRIDVKPKVKIGGPAKPVKRKPEASRSDQPMNGQHGKTPKSTGMSQPIRKSTRVSQPICKPTGMSPPQRKSTGMSQLLISMLALSAVNVCDFNQVPPDDMFDYSKFACFDEPLSTAEALRAPDRDFWCAAMEEEVNSFFDNGTWVVVRIDPSWNLLRSRWIFKRKLRKDGSIERYRARLVAKGFMQRSGIDYGEIFSPVVRYSTVRIILALCAHYGLYKRHFDAPKAFTQADLDTPCYMKAPTCVKIPKGSCLMLKKSV